MTSPLGLIDANNFYASAERVFDPKLARRPVVVLSNNDGCIVARSKEAKEIGIPMGAPCSSTGASSKPSTPQSWAATMRSTMT